MSAVRMPRRRAGPRRIDPFGLARQARTLRSIMRRRGSVPPGKPRLFQRVTAPSLDGLVERRARADSSRGGSSPIEPTSAAPRSLRISRQIRGKDGRRTAPGASTSCIARCPRTSVQGARGDTPPRGASRSAARAGTWPARWPCPPMRDGGARLCAAESVMADALDFAGGVSGLVGGALGAARAFRAVFAEIDVAGEFPDDVNTHFFGALRAQRRQALQEARSSIGGG